MSISAREPARADVDPIADAAEGGGEPQAARAQEVAQALLRLVEQLALELHPHRRGRLQVTLDSAIERELGLDSLARTELMVRLERELGVTVPASALGEAETLRDVLSAALGSVHEADEVDRSARPLVVGPAAGVPTHAQTLGQVLAWHAETDPDRPHIILRDDAGHETILTYGDLAGRAAAMAEGLLARGLQPGDRAALMLPTGEDFFVAFFGILGAGATPVPIYPPLRPSQLESHLKRQAGILRNAGVTALVTFTEARIAARLLASQVESLNVVDTVAHISAPGEHRFTPGAAGEATALLQYTSGSTGDPKGVILSHTNLLTNIRAIAEGAQARPGDRLVSWLPLYHDMGLIGSWLACLYLGFPTLIMSPISFLTKPSRWLWAIHRHRATISPSPNFGYELCVRHFDPAEYEGLDLSCVRFMMNGAEPVSPETMRRFAATFAPYGLRAEALAPVYGLAENALALAFPPPGRGPISDRISRTALAKRGEAVPCAADAGDMMEVMACGRPLVGHEIRVVDALGHELGERSEGRVQFRGPSATAGYYANEARTRQLFDGDWLETGDRGYIAGGEIHLTGRSKDMIIRAGRNVYPHELEEAVGELEGVRKGCVAVFGAADRESGTERLVVLAETRLTDDESRASLTDRIIALTTELLDAPPDDVVLAPPQTVLKTSSGKIRRAASREAYQHGRLAQRPTALWWQLVRLGGAGVAPQLRRAMRAAGGMLYAAWWWFAFVAIAFVQWSATIVLPRLSWRWAVVRSLARLHLFVTGTPLRVTGLEHRPAGACILVSNHASYLDGYIGAAALPGQPVFVAKGELRGNYLVSLLLRRLGARFVDRFDTSGSEAAGAELKAAIAEGAQLVVFAEGTLTRRPGLARFRLGAFTVACECNVPVVPMVLSGTRNVMRGDQWTPRRHRIDVTLHEPMRPTGASWQDAVALRDATRAVMLEACGEPDLVAEQDALLDLKADAAHRSTDR